jgi:hypothetical protein
MWQAIEVSLPKTASSTEGCRVFTDWKKFHKCSSSGS